MYWDQRTVARISVITDNKKQGNFNKINLNNFACSIHKESKLIKMGKKQAAKQKSE